MKLFTAVGFISIGLSAHLLVYSVDAACRKREATPFDYDCAAAGMFESKREFNQVLCCRQPGGGGGCAEVNRNPPLSLEDSKCRSNEVEIYHEMDMGNRSSFCCTQDDPNKSYWTKLVHCRATKCMPESDENSATLCTHALPRLFIDNKEQNLVEVTRDQCNDANGQTGSAGVAAICCVPETQEEYLTVISGSEPKEFPHFVRVGMNGCGGAIYNERWVITASHCVVNHDKTRQVYDPYVDGQKAWDDNLGTVRLNLQIRDATTKHTYNIVEVYVHPGSSYIKPKGDPEADPLVSINDIALLKLDRNIEFDENVKAIKIAEPGFDPLKYGEYGLLTGFGDSDTLWQPMHRLKANLLLHPKDKVNIMNFKDYHKQLMFAGGNFNGTVTPNVGRGDSGGPLLCREKDGMPVLCGVVGFLTANTPECLSDLSKCNPSSFVDVQYFNKWIKRVTGEEQKSSILLKQPLYGSEVKKNEFPAHVHIKSPDGVTCGGTLIEDDVVITAAHCVATDSKTLKSNVEVMADVTDLNGGDGRKLKVHGIVVHPEFRKVSRWIWGGGGRKKRVVSIVLESWQQKRITDSAIMRDPYYTNNLALIKLYDKSGITPAKLASRSPVTGNFADEIAYRFESLGTASTQIPLMKREFKMLSREDCQERMDRLKGINYDVQVDENVVCGVEYFSGGSMCDRELGGGLYCRQGYGHAALCGIQVSRLCQFNIPNEFLDVASMRNWLDLNLAQLKNWTGK